MLIGDISRRNGRRYPTKPAVIFGDAELTWAALDERANRLATYLLAHGLRPGDRVAVFARNTLEWPEIIFGLSKAGVVLVPANVRMAAGEAAYILEDSGCRAAIVHTDQVGAFGDVVQGLDALLEIDGSALGIEYSKALEA